MTGRPRRFPEMPQLGLAAACVLVLAAAAWANAPRSDAVAEQAAPVGPEVVELTYRVNAGEWRDAGRPSLCQIVHHYGLGEEAAAATLYLNGRGGRCASPGMPAGPNMAVRLAVWAPPGFAQCRDAAVQCQ